MASFGLGEVGIMLAISGGSMFMIKFMGLCGTAMESKWLTRIVNYSWLPPLNRLVLHFLVHWPGPTRSQWHCHSSP